MLVSNAAPTANKPRPFTAPVANKPDAAKPDTDRQVSRDIFISAQGAQSEEDRDRVTGILGGGLIGLFVGLGIGGMALASVLSPAGVRALSFLGAAVGAGIGWFRAGR
jgi:uncharacterized protein YcfJ